MKLSIVIPCRDAAPTLGEQLDAMSGQSWEKPWEVILADNGSTDDSVKVARRYQGRLPNMRIVDASERRGGAFARNKGAREAAGESLAFCDADDVVAPGWLKAIGNGLERHDLVASRFDFTQLNREVVALTRKNRQSEGLQVYQNPPFLPHSGGCGLGIKRRLHEKVGGFDEAMKFLHDTDYCWRLQLMGVKLHFLPDAVIHVRFRDTPLRNYRQARNSGEYNVLLYARYRQRGMPPIQWSRGLRGWATVVRGVPQLRHEAGRLKWARRLGWRVGRLRGCVKYRVLAP